MPPSVIDFYAKALPLIAEGSLAKKIYFVIHKSMVYSIGNPGGGPPFLASTGVTDGVVILAGK